MLTVVLPSLPLAEVPTATGWIALVSVAVLTIGLAVRLLVVQRRSAVEVAELDRQLAEERDNASVAHREKDTLVRENQGKSEMVATLSREVRAHLNGIMGSADLLLDVTLTPAQREHLSTLRASAEALHQSLNDILDYSIIEAGKLRIENLPFTLKDPLIEVVEHLSPLATLKGLELVLIISPEVPRYVSGDAARLRQVLLNLMSNSVRFTSAGRVVLHVSLPQGSRAASIRGASWLHFSVSDTGTGIPESMQTTLFDRFALSDTPAPRKVGGSGLDLAISKRLVELMGGNIGVRGLPEVGVEFWVTLPFGSDRDEVQSIPEPVEGTHVVVLDDLAASRVSISTMLAQLGVEQDAADTVGRAEELLRDAHDAGSRDLALLLDESVAQEHASDLARLFTSDAYLRSVRVILMTPDPEAAPASTQRLPLSAVLRKPVLRANLLMKALKTPPRPDPGVGAVREAAPSKVEEAPVTRKGPRVLVVDDDEISRSVTAQLLERLGCVVERAIGGTQAIEQTRRTKYDLIFMDCQMPDLDGFATTERILAEKPIDTPPIVALTASTTVKDREKCFAAGMCDFVDKPARKAELNRVLKRWTRSDLP